MKNIHILPTDKPSRLAILNSGKLNFGAEFISSSNSKAQNIYITYDEEIKEGDWFLTPINELERANKEWMGTIVQFIPKTNFKKIILTTDQDLIKDGVQAIDDDFLEWFVKNPSCEKVNIEKVGGKYFSDRTIGVISYEIIIPKEQPKIKDKILSETSEEVKQRVRDTANKLVIKQETLEEAIDNYVYKTSNEKNICDIVVKAIKFGVKWQQERSYSEEEVLDIVKQAYSMGRSNYTIKAFNEWFEEFKKK